MFIAALLTLAKAWKQSTCPSVNGWVKKMWYLYAMEYYSAIREDEILPFVTTWIDLENMMLSETSQMEKDKNHENSLIGRT